MTRILPRILRSESLDITILNRPADQLDRNPRPEDIALLIEVSDTD